MIALHGKSDNRCIEYVYFIRYFFYFTALKTTPLNVIETLFHENPRAVKYDIYISFA